MTALLRRVGTVAYSRYLAVSAAALAVDLGLFLLLRAAELPMTVVSALSYGAGIVTHWLLSSRLVFADGLRTPGTARTAQQALFVASGLAGLALTVAIVSLAGLVIDPRLAKLVAIVVSFQTTWWLRRSVVFA